MSEIVKHINDTNASYRTLGAGDAKNTDLFLDNEHYDLFRDAGEQITVRFNKENLQKAILFIASILPRKYDNSATHKTIPFSSAFVLDQLAFIDAFFTVDGKHVDTRTQVWNARKDVEKKNGEIDSRFYFNGLLEDVSYKSIGGEFKTAKFTIRNYVAGGYSDLHIKKSDDGIFDVWVTNVFEPYNDGKEKGYEKIDNSNLTLQQIYFGAPGTGKSNAVKRQTGELLDNGEEIDLPNVFRTTFHPDTDYASFVGCYKPAMESKEPIYTPAQLIDKLSTIKNSGVSYPCQKFGAKYWESLKELPANDIKQILSACGFTDSMSVEIPKGIAIGEEFASLNSNKQIVYRFVPQAFTDAYVYAYTHSTEQTYLVIEEINRGNCAQIFGDLFQLLDRKGGVSEYKVKADKDLANYLIDKLGEDSEGIKDGKLCLPANLSILATMNTSDQSLFPMDSAFKRRWEWEYVPINYGTAIKSGSFEITIGEKSYLWVDFIKEANKRIFDLTQSEDKQLGNFFIKHSVDEKEFKSKVMFYLWYEVLRDETENNKYFFYKKTTVDGKEESGKFVFKDLYEEDATQILQQFMEYLCVSPK